MAEQSNQRKKAVRLPAITGYSRNIWNMEKKSGYNISYKNLIEEVFRENPSKPFTQTEIIKHIKQKNRFYGECKSSSWETDLKRTFDYFVGTLFFKVEGTDFDGGSYFHCDYLPRNYQFSTVLKDTNPNSRMNTFHGNRNNDQLDSRPRNTSLPLRVQKTSSKVPYQTPNYSANAVASGFQENVFPTDFSSTNFMTKPVFVLEETTMNDPNFSHDLNASSNQYFQPLQSSSYSAPYTQNFQQQQYFLYDPNEPYNKDFQIINNFPYVPNIQNFQSSQNFQPDQHFQPGQNFQPSQNFQRHQNFQSDQNFQSGQNFPYLSLYPQNCPPVQNVPQFPNGQFSQNFQPIQNFSYAPDISQIQQFQPDQNYYHSQNVQRVFKTNPTEMLTVDIAPEQNNSLSPDEVRIQNSPMTRNAIVQNWLEKSFPLKPEESNGIEDVEPTGLLMLAPQNSTSYDKRWRQND